MSAHAEYIAARVAEMRPPTQAELTDLSALLAPVVEAVAARRPQSTVKPDARRAA